MKTKNLILLMCFFTSMSFTSLYSQTESDYAGKFVYEAENNGTYTLNLKETGTKGKYTGDLDLDFSVFGYKLTLTAEIKLGELYVYYGKTLSGMFNQKSEFDRASKVLMFKLLFVNEGEFVTWAKKLEIKGMDADDEIMNDGNNFVKVN